MPFISSMERWYQKMKLTWLKNRFICKDLYAPFKLDKDVDYRDDLEKNIK